MNEHTCELYPFLKAAGGNWRNALFVRCGKLPCADMADCSGFLFCADADGRPLLVPEHRFRQLSGEQIDPAERAAQLDWRAFASSYHLWLVWTIENPAHCPCLQIESPM